MRTLTSAIVAMVLATASITVNAQNTSLNDPEHGWGCIGGYRGYDLGNKSFSHKNNPGDSFLSGDAGTTEIDGISSYLLIGFRYQTAPIAKSWTMNFDMGGLIGGQRDQRQNANDSRPPANGSFIYSQDRFGIMGGVGLSYNVNRWSFGVQVEGAGIFVGNGWNRYNKDQSENTKLVGQFSAGPKIGLRLSESIRGELGVQFGGRTPMPTFSLSYLF